MVDSHDLPEALVQMYDQAEAAWHRISTGPVPEHVLVSLVAVSGSVVTKEPEPSFWSGVELHTPVVVDNGTTAYEAEFIRVASNGRLEVRELQSDEYKKMVLERFVKLKKAPREDRLDWPQKLWFVERGERVHWAPEDGEVSEVKFHNFENGKVQIKAGKQMTKNEYVDVDSIIVLEPVEAT